MLFYACFINYVLSRPDYFLAKSFSSKQVKHLESNVKVFSK